MKTCNEWGTLCPFGRIENCRFIITLKSCNLLISKDGAQERGRTAMLLRARDFKSVLTASKITKWLICIELRRLIPASREYQRAQKGAQHAAFKRQDLSLQV